MGKIRKVPNNPGKFPGKFFEKFPGNTFPLTEHQSSQGYIGTFCFRFWATSQGTSKGTKIGTFNREDGWMRHSTVDTVEYTFNRPDGWMSEKIFPLKISFFSHANFAHENVGKKRPLGPRNDPCSVPHPKGRFFEKNLVGPKAVPHPSSKRALQWNIFSPGKFALQISVFLSYSALIVVLKPSFVGKMLFPPKKKRFPGDSQGGIPSYTGWFGPHVCPSITAESLCWLPPPRLLNSPSFNLPSVPGVSGRPQTSGLGLIYISLCCLSPRFPFPGSRFPESRRLGSPFRASSRLTNFFFCGFPLIRVFPALSICIPIKLAPNARTRVCPR